MMAAQKLKHLIDQLPKVRGTLTADIPIARLTWFRVGGNAEILFEPADQEDLQAFLQALPQEIDVTVLGGASNLIIRDGGIAGVTIKLGRPFSKIDIDRSTVIAGESIGAASFKPSTLRILASPIATAKPRKIGFSSPRLCRVFRKNPRLSLHAWTKSHWPERALNH